MVGRYKPACVGASSDVHFLTFNLIPGYNMLAASGFPSYDSRTIDSEVSLSEINRTCLCRCTTTSFDSVQPQPPYFAPSVGLQHCFTGPMELFCEFYKRLSQRIAAADRMIHASLDQISMLETWRKSQELVTEMLTADLQEQSNLANLQANTLSSLRRQMSQSANEMVKLWDSVECALCLEPLWEPRILQCGHTICSGCCDQSQLCPFCRVEITRRPAVPFLLRDIVHSLAILLGIQESISRSTNEAHLVTPLLQDMEIDEDQAV